jgi:hypothetical protein
MKAPGRQAQDAIMLKAVIATRLCGSHLKTTLEMTPFNIFVLSGVIRPCA